MKKIIVGFIMFVMVFAFLAGNVPTASAEVKKVDLAICGGSIGGAWAAIGEGVGEGDGVEVAEGEGVGDGVGTTVGDGETIGAGAGFTGVFAPTPAYLSQAVLSPAK